MPCANIAYADLPIANEVTEHGMRMQFHFDVDRNGLILTRIEMSMCEGALHLLNDPTIHEGLNLAIQAIWDCKALPIKWPEAKEWVK